jgi:hypothetical protein
MTKTRQRERKKTQPERDARKHAERERKWEELGRVRQALLERLFGVKEEYSEAEEEAADEVENEETGFI